VIRAKKIKKTEMNRYENYHVSFSYPCKIKSVWKATHGKKIKYFSILPFLFSAVRFMNEDEKKIVVLHLSLVL
jgi:hypothetical protein